MKKLLSILFLLIGFIAFGQDLSPLPSITIKKLIAPCNPTFYYNLADSSMYEYSDCNGWYRFARKVDIKNNKVTSINFTGTYTKTVSIQQIYGGTKTATFTDLDNQTLSTSFVGNVHTITISNGNSVGFDVSDPTKEPVFSKGDIKTGTPVLTVDNGTARLVGGTATISITSGYTIPSTTSATSWDNKQQQLNGTGFVKASGTTISYDNSNYEPAFTKNTAFNKNFGTTAGTVLEGRTFGTVANNNTGDFIWNGTNQQPNSNFNISGNGNVGGSINSSSYYMNGYNLFGNLSGSAGYGYSARWNGTGFCNFPFAYDSYQSHMVVENSMLWVTGLADINSNVDGIGIWGGDTGGGIYARGVDGAQPFEILNTQGSIKLQSNGAIQISKLAGTNTRIVGATNDGTLTNIANGTGLFKNDGAGNWSYITDNSTKWNTAYDRSPTAVSVTGTNTKTLTVTKQDGSSLSTSFADMSGTVVNTYMNNDVAVTTQTISVTFPDAMPNTNYYVDLTAWYNTTVSGKSVQLMNAISDFSKTVNGFSFKVDTVAGYYKYIAVTGSNLYPLQFSNYIPTTALVTAVGNPGSDANIPSEKAVRTAIGAISFTETDPVVKAINGIVKSNGSTISAAVSGTDYLTPTGSAAGLTNFPTFNQNTTGTAANVTGIVAESNGGTGVNNSGKKITLGGNLTTSGAYTTNLTVTANTAITLPPSGTLATCSGGETLTNKDYDITDPLSTNLSYSGLIESGTVGEAVAFGDVLYLKFSDGKWWKAKADTYATTPGARMAMAAIAANASGLLLIQGNVRYDSWAFATNKVYLSEATSGAATTTQPSTTGNQIQVLGIAKTATTMFFNPSNDVGEK